MSKKKILIAAVVLLLVIGASAAFFYLYRFKGRKEPVAKPSPLPAAREEVKADVLYEDASGFSIKHPESVAIEDVTPDDEVFYTLLNLVGPTRLGDRNLKITIKDTKYKDIDEWFEKDTDAPESAELVGATSLAAISASQYSYSLNGDEVLLTVALDQGVIYLIEGPKDSGYWEDVQNLVVSTFAFAGSSEAAGGGSQNVIYEAEEVIE